MVLVGASVAIGLYFIDWRTPIIRTEQNLKFVQIFGDSLDAEVDKECWMNAVWAGLGFGCQLFVVQSLFSDTAVLLSWANLPSPKPGAAVTFPFE